MQVTLVFSVTQVTASHVETHLVAAETPIPEFDMNSSVPISVYKGKYEWAGDPVLGDCSLIIKNAIADYDDGEWECQVTPSDFTTQDALTSQPIRLVVRGK
ncbi:hypothetical protein V9T40_009928 [Parthenolecanium corni]|uniref:Ig-like domain-containing protein n=1 Tax=Parthenolecanium corni TaxID=536013 RepID=A0AAN9TLV2_9HEMI